MLRAVILVGIAAGNGLDDGGIEFDFLQRQEDFHSSTASRPVLGLIRSPIQWVLGNLSLRVRRSRRDAFHSPPSYAEVKNAWSCTSFLPYVFIAWCLINYSQRQLYLYFTIRFYSLSY
jgi:hypothetical protein